MWDILLLDCHAATMAEESREEFGVIRNAAIALKGGRIAWIGPAKNRPSGKARRTRRLHGAWVTPGLVDCHTHLVFGGERVGDWRLRQAALGLFSNGLTWTGSPLRRRPGMWPA